jgi:galactokinase
MKNNKTANKLHTFSENDSAVNNYFKNKSREVAPVQRNAQSVSAEMELVMKRKRSIVLTIATKTGIKEVNDFKRFNAWMKKSSVLKKDLHAYTYQELDDLIK